MAKNSKNYTQKPKGATKAPAAAGSEAEEEVPVTKLPLRGYGGQTVGPNWEQLPRPPIGGAYIDEEYPPPENTHRQRTQSDAEKRADEKAEVRAKLHENGLRQQRKDLVMLRTFVKVVAARVTPSYLRDRVEEQMKTVPANDLTWSTNKGTAMVQSVAVKKTTKDAALLSMQRKPTKLYETSGNSEEITHAHRVETSSRNEVQRCGPSRRKSERGTH
ncbi:hypothetical protein DYB37_009356 [Aphanomyces astaci]|uniref:Uncharacterized protein n=1 Tax=Aphanomyces astaci TaxID=112090 RepID=A0A3R7EUQ4_APHAT|nr:hypothetical protein DYB35_010515 [Aphanomyces astaci]RHZ15160.1 hypothetical protein DYB37_009356 [Aphanomyces astaci]